MNIRTRPVRDVLVLAAALLLLADCTAIVRGTRQKIPVTSAPAGAMVLVDGRAVGTTPVILKLHKKRPAVIRIEKDGYNPHEIRVTRDKTGMATESAIFGNTVLALMSGSIVLMPIMVINESHDYRVVLPVTLALMAAVFIGVDFASGAPYPLTPESLDVTLTPAGQEARVDVTRIDEARLRNLKWLSVRAGASDGGRGARN